MLTFIYYPKCTTCQKAKALLDSYHAQFETRDIKTDNPSYDELKAWLGLSGLPIKKFFNTSGQLYRSLGLKDKLPSMSEDECLKLLATDGMLVKRPLLVDEFRVLVGFKPDEWNFMRNVEEQRQNEMADAKLAEPMDIDEYIAALPEHIRQDVQKVRLMIKMALPDATEKISWDMPTYWKGRNLIHFAAHKNHLGIYPGAEAMVHFAPRLTKLKTSKGAIQLPYTLISKHLQLIAEIATWCAKSVE